jgi:hypothetical protein
MQIEIVMLIYLVSGIVPDYLRGLSDLHAPPSTMGSSEFPYSLDGKRHVFLLIRKQKIFKNSFKIIFYFFKLWEWVNKSIQNK